MSPEAVYGAVAWVPVNPLDDFISAAAGSRGPGLFALCDGIL